MASAFMPSWNRSRPYGGIAPGPRLKVWPALPWPVGSGPMPRRGAGFILVHVDPITAMGRRPFLASAWPWRAWAYLATACVPGALGLSVLAADLAVGGGLAKAL